MQYSVWGQLGVITMPKLSAFFSSDWRGFKGGWWSISWCYLWLWKTSKPMKVSIGIGIDSTLTPEWPQQLQKRKKTCLYICKPLFLLVGMRGFGPLTPTSRTWCSTRLSYTPTSRVFYPSGHFIDSLSLARFQAIKYAWRGVMIRIVKRSAWYASVVSTLILRFRAEYTRSGL